MSALHPRPRPCPCGEPDTRLYFLGWRCATCHPTEAAIRKNAIELAARRDRQALKETG